MGATKFPLVPPPAGGTPNLPGPGQPAPMRPDEFAPGSVANVVSFGFDKLSPPSTVYVQRDDILIMTVVSSRSTAETVTFNGRFLRVPEPQGGQPSDGGVGKHPGAIFTRGIIEPFSFQVQALAANGIAVKVQTLAEGYLLSLGAACVAASQRGQTFVRAWLMRGNPNNAPFTQATAYALLADYATNTHAITWPGGRLLFPNESTGFLHSVQVANPGAGVDWTLTVPVSTRYRVISMEAQLAVANSGAARPVEIIVDDGANIYARMSANTTAPINATANINFSNAGTPSVSIVSDLYVQMPAGLIVPAGHRIRSNTTNIVAGDTWTNIWFLMEEFLDSV